MRAELIFWLLIGMGVMAVLAMFRFTFALRFWVHVRRLGYLYVGFIVGLAVLSVVLGKRL